jgi:hypothetical protein
MSIRPSSTHHRSTPICVWYRLAMAGGQLWVHIQLGAVVQGEWRIYPLFQCLTARTRHQVFFHTLDDRLHIFAGAHSQSKHTIWQRGFLKLRAQVEGCILDGSILYFEIRVQLFKQHTRFMVYTQNVFNIDQDVGPILFPTHHACVSMHVEV